MNGNGWLSRALMSGLLAAGPLAGWSMAQEKTENPARAPGAPHRATAPVPVIVPATNPNGSGGQAAPDEARGTVEVQVQIDGKTLTLPVQIKPNFRISNVVDEDRVIAVDQAIDNADAASKARGDAIRTLIIQSEDREHPDSTYWIGVQADPAPEVLRTYLGLSKDQGLSVLQVVPDSPAAKAGLQANDVITTVDGKPVGDVQELISAIEAPQGMPIKLMLLRAGKSLEIAVTPGKRPEGSVSKRPNAPAGAELKLDSGNVFFVNPDGDKAVPNPKDMPNDARSAEVQKWIAGHMAAPGQMIATAPQVIAFSAGKMELPDDVTVVVTRQGKQPTKIMVTKGKDSWEVTDSQLDKLPEPIRALVMMAIGPPMPFAMPMPSGAAMGGGTFNVRVAQPSGVEVHGEARTSNGSESRDEMIMRRLDKIQRDVEALSRESNERRSR